MEAHFNKHVLTCISDLFEKVLAQKAKFENRPTSINVMESFEYLSGTLHKVSCDAMAKTQLSLFDEPKSML